MQRLPVWDLPTRLFHWLLAASVAAALATGKVGGNLMEWHGRAGLLILGLVVFRVLWGFIGPDTARFSSFVRGPRAIKAYLKGEWRGVGHNPLGALAVLVLLALAAAQAATGLFTNDDIAFQGPLADLAGKDASDWLTGLHRSLFYALLGIVALHLAAIAFYARVKGENLVLPMVTGWKEADPDAVPDDGHPSTPIASRGRYRLALAISVVVASTAVYGVSGALETPPPAPAVQPAAAPGW